MTMQIFYTDTKALELSERFVAVLREWLTPQEFAEMKRLNETPEYQGTVCASHNFCDANMAMYAAWTDCVADTMDANDEAQAALWNAAWDLARKRHLGVAPPA